MENISIGIPQIITIVLFVLSFPAVTITVVQDNKPLSERIGMFRDEAFLTLVSLPAWLFTIGSSIYLIISSWVLFLIVAGSTIVLTPILLNRIMLRLIMAPTYMILEKLVKKGRAKR